MPGVFFAMEKRPGKTEAKTGPGDKCNDDSDKGLSPTYILMVVANQFYSPCLHTQCLTSMCPEPAVIKKTYCQQAKGKIRVIGVVRANSFTTIQKVGDDSGHKKNGDKQE